MKWLLILAVTTAVALAAGLLVRRTLGGVQEAGPDATTPSYYDLTTRTLAGETVDLSMYRGQVALVVNLASKCGLTPQYKGLQTLYEDLAPRGFVILGFPSNDFMGQEPGTPAEIQEFCSLNYGVTFPLFEKMKVKGNGRSDVYRLLTANLEAPTWNFTKYLVDRAGNVVYRFGPRTAPDDADLREKIEALLSVEIESGANDPGPDAERRS